MDKVLVAWASGFIGGKIASYYKRGFEVIGRNHSEDKENEHHDDVEKGIDDMFKRAKECSTGFEQLLLDLEKE